MKTLLKIPLQESHAYEKVLFACGLQNMMNTSKHLISILGNAVTG